MIISRTPFRVSFFGGGTDLPEFFLQNRGAVIGTAIDKYIYHSVSKFPSELFDYNTKVSYSKVECVNNVDELVHSPFREILKHEQILKDIEIHIAADLPSFSGLGSSSSFTVGLVNALRAFKGEKITPLELANESIRIEREILNEAVGYQDQTFAAFGGLNLIRFDCSNNIIVEKMPVSTDTFEELSESFIMFFTGITRRASQIEAEKIKQIGTKKNNLNSLLYIVDEAYDLLVNGRQLDRVGDLLHRGWIEKKELSNSVSNEVIDEIYNVAMQNGALGGKLLGAGGGGFMLFFVPPEKRMKLKNSLSHLCEIPFKMDAPGSTIIYS